MGKTRRWMFLVVLLLSMSLIVLACSSNSGNETTSPENDAETTGEETPPAKEPAPNDAEPAESTEEPAEITIFHSDFGRTVPSGDLMEDPQVKYLAEQTNTVLDLVFLPHENYEEQHLALKYASGEFPDVVQLWGIGNSRLVAQGLALPLNDLIEEHGPNMKKLIPQSAWDAVTVNGNIVAIPKVQSGKAPSERALYVRQDWMDKLKLETPKTSDELLDVLRAIRDGDPNGNGEKDEIPFSARSNFSWIENIFGMWGVIPSDNAFTLHEGELIPSIIHPNTKQALGFIRTMVEEDLIDDEFLTNNRSVWDQKIKSDRVGMWNHTVNSMNYWNGQLTELLPDKQPLAKTIPTPQGAGYDGPVGMLEKAVLTTYIVHKDAENPEAIIKFFDWYLTEEGKIFREFGLQGVTWEYNDEGKIVYDSDKNREMNYNWRGNLGISDGLRVENRAYTEEQQRLLELSDAAYEIARKEGIPNLAASMPSLKSMQSNPDLLASGILFQEAATQIVLGEKPLSHFDEFVEQWRNEGGTEIIQEATEWYNASR